MIKKRTPAAPVGISTYIRITHLKRNIEALKKDVLAEETCIFIFSDGPKSGDEVKVKQLREYLNTIDGFKNVTILEREQNNRVVNNRSGIRMLLEEYGRLIFLEEDIETAPGFLSYMNQALEQYQDDKRVFSITGYCPSITIPEDYPHDGFFLRRFNAWGLGIWKDRFESIDYVDKASFRNLLNTKGAVRDFTSAGGQDMLGMLRLDSEGSIDALDVKAMYAQYIFNQYTLYPRHSLTRNTGMDGSGTHCPATSKYDVDLWDKCELFDLPDFSVDDRIVKSHYKYRKPNFRVRISEKIKMIMEM